MDKVTEFLHECGVLDVESTSPEPETCEIIELAYGFLTNGDWHTISHHYKPSIEIPPESAEKHFITDEMVANSPAYPAAYNEEHGFGIFTQNVKYFVAHNAHYDRTAINENNLRHGITDQRIADTSNWICTLKLAQKLFNNENALPAYRLGALWFRFKLYQGVTRQIIPHQADSDIYMAGRLLEFLVRAMVDAGIIDGNQDVGPQVVDFLNKPTLIKLWPFGKHKGTPLPDVPADYLSWAFSNMDMLNEKNANFDYDLAWSISVAFGQVDEMDPSTIVWGIDKGM